MKPNGLKHAYALLGLSFFIVFVGAFIVIERANAPTPDELRDTAPTYESNESSMLTLTSPVFQEGAPIPAIYTCDGENINPELRIEEVPQGTRAFALVMDDPDIPDAVKESRGIEKFDHWVLYNIPADTTVIPENTSVGNEGTTSRGSEGYVGPCPPDSEHRYIFRLYALSEELSFDHTPTLDEVEAAAQAVAIENATLIGVYNRPGNAE